MCSKAGTLRNAWVMISRSTLFSILSFFDCFMLLNWTPLDWLLSFSFYTCFCICIFLTFSSSSAFFWAASRSWYFIRPDRIRLLFSLAVCDYLAFFVFCFSSRGFDGFCFIETPSLMADSLCSTARICSSRFPFFGNSLMKSLSSESTSEVGDSDTPS